MKRLIGGILVAFSVVSVSMGAYIPKDYEENYQKLKAEMEGVEQSGNWDRIGATCSWSEDGKVVVIKNSNLSHLYGTKGKEWCHLKNVLAFFDEIRAMEVKVDKKKGEREFYVAINKVKQMPRFKEDYGIGITQMSINESRFTAGDNGFWNRVFEKWEILKMELEISKYMN